jgi:hypothetical protein
MIECSSIANGERVLQQDDVPTMYAILRYLAHVWRKRFSVKAVDVEFLILNEAAARKVVILQVRPF